MIELLAAAEIVLAFDGLKDQGQVLVALYDSEASYKARNRALKDVTVPVRGGRAEVVLRGLKPGTYAAMAFHDLNSDRRMNFRLGLPSEPYAVSNNAKGFPIAGWSAAKFQVGDGETRHAIRLK
ncbi:DUF2141 domain-containing protein [Phenylobacterium sp.]|jgi:uncharacterized protein (DUF2141 family)|uniref:DUF2141 domain-containing protein n=1 Tax=Phenylobacterium sp. TaxID=1871053 RepID=UPI002F93F577